MLLEVATLLGATGRELRQARALIAEVALLHGDLETAVQHCMKAVLALKDSKAKGEDDEEDEEKDEEAKDGRGKENRRGVAIGSSRSSTSPGPDAMPSLGRVVAAVAAADATVLCDEYDAASVTERQRLLVEAAILHCGAEKKTAITTTSTSTSTSMSMSTSMRTSARSKKVSSDEEEDGLLASLIAIWSRLDLAASPLARQGLSHEHKRRLKRIEDVAMRGNDEDEEDAAAKKGAQKERHPLDSTDEEEEDEEEEEEEEEIGGGGGGGGGGGEGQGAGVT